LKRSFFPYRRRFFFSWRAFSFTNSKPFLLLGSFPRIPTFFPFHPRTLIGPPPKEGPFSKPRGLFPLSTYYSLPPYKARPFSGYHRKCLSLQPSFRLEWMGVLWRKNPPFYKNLNLIPPPQLRPRSSHSGFLFFFFLEELAPL